MILCPDRDDEVYDDHDHAACPKCADLASDRTLGALLGWLLAFVFGALWLFDSMLARFVGAVAAEIVS